MACHHGNGPAETSGSEYTTWINRDPHSRAYEALFTPLAVRIGKNLRSPEPHQDGRCLACHVGPFWEEAKRNPRYALEDGVGCESCHGPAQQWLGEHSRDAWRQKSLAEKALLGMRDTKTLAGRAGVCVACHVGAPGMDVNHDLIAAGHPRLAFELTSYHAAYPHHWPAWKDRKVKQPARQVGFPHQADRQLASFEARLWAEGQLAALQASLQLLQARAASSTWPELAEHDCFACHHELRAPGWRQQRQAKRPPGALAMNRWYVGGLTLVPWPDAEQWQPALQQNVQTLDTLLQKPLAQRGQLDKALKEILATLPTVSARVRQARLPAPESLFQQLRAAGQPRSQEIAGSWDDAMQYYLALAACYHSWRAEGPQDERQPAAALALRSLAETLRLPSGYDSPVHFVPASVQRRFAAQD